MAFKPEHHEPPQGVEYKKEETQEKINRIWELFETEKPNFETLIPKLQEPLREGRWDSILGDDVSGRLPALVIGRIAARVAEREGKDSPKRLFLAAGTGLSPERIMNIEKYIKENKEQLGNRTLFVTEWISTGQSVSNLGAVFNEHGVKFDIAALRADFPEQILRNMRARVSGNPSHFFFSDSKTEGLGFYTRREETGIEKKAYPDEPLASRNFWADPEVVATARKKANEFADELYEKYFSEKSDNMNKAA